MYEGQLAQLQQQTFNMESAALTTENLRNTMATVEAMKQANKEIKKQYGKIDIDKIEVPFRHWRLACLGLADAGCCRICIMIWRISWSRRMRFRRR